MSTRPDRLLVAVDFGETTAAVVSHAASLATRFEAGVILLHAVEYVPYYPYYPATAAGLAEIRKSVELQMLGLEHLLQARGVPVLEKVVELGRAPTVILQQAERLKASALVLGAASNGVLDWLFVGSTASQVVHSAHQPVFLHHPGDPDEPIAKLLCGVDYSPHSHHTLETTLRLARLLHAGVYVLHAAPQPGHYPGLPGLTLPVHHVEHAPAAGNAPPTPAGELEELHRFIAQCDTRGVAVWPLLEHGRPHEVLRDRARELRPGLMVLGARSGSTANLNLVFGDTTTRIMRQVPCSLLVVKDWDLLPTETLALLQQRAARGRELLAQGALSAARTEFEFCLQQDDRYAPAYEGLAAVSDREGQPEAAARFRNLAADARPGVFAAKPPASLAPEHPPSS